jgi:hypothetical protein
LIPFIRDWTIINDSKLGLADLYCCFRWTRVKVSLLQGLFNYLWEFFKNIIVLHWKVVCNSGVWDDWHWIIWLYNLNQWIFQCVIVVQNWIWYIKVCMILNSRYSTLKCSIVVEYTFQYFDVAIEVCKEYPTIQCKIINECCIYYFCIGALVISYNYTSSRYWVCFIENGIVNEDLAISFNYK